MGRSGSTSKAVGVQLLAGVLVLNALWRGGVSWQAQALTAVLCAAALVMAVHRPARHRGGDLASSRKPASVLVLALGGMALLVALQLAPLPPAVLAALSPAGAEVQASTLGPLGGYPAWRPLSLDPGATALELAKLASWTMAAAAAAVLARSRERQERLLRALGLAGAAVAVACYGAALAGLGRLTESGAVFVNPNHLASFLALTCWIALGFGLRARGPQRVAWLGAFVAAGSQVFLSLSRAGIAAFFVGAGVAAILAIRSGHAARAVEGLAGERSWRALRPFVAPVAVFSALAVTAWLALDRVVGELRTLTEIDADVKLSLWPLAWQALGQHPLVGVGRGAFGSVFPAYKVEPAQVTFTHLENTWLQVPLDVGVPAGLALLAILGWAWVAAVRSRDLSRPMIGALAGIAAVAAHDLFDFSLELNAVAVPFLVVLALGSAGLPSLQLPRWAFKLAAVAGLALAGLGFGLHLPHQADLQANRVIAAETTSEAMSRAAEALAWHPADWVPLAAVGVRLVDEGRCREGVEWLNRAMLRNPTAPQPHRAAARCLAASGQAEAARREYRLAFAYGDRDALEEAAHALGDPEVVLEVAPATPAGLMTAAALVVRLLPERPEVAREAYRRAWDTFRLPAALAGLARATIASEAFDEALALARALQAAAPVEPAGYVVAADALVRLDREEEAV
ncbi:MAG: O-antigen ligase family protein, partial [Anaeromyxobacteraceae bacterium]|nr:O-antigen ligase family protein [Anaeromyxobacteraceae bacterium]